MKKILIADDDEATRRLVMALFHDQYEVIEASNGLEVMGLLPISQVDLLLLDIKMPQMDGYEVIKQIRQTPFYDKLPIILLTSIDDVMLCRRLIGDHIQDLIRKPCDIQILEQSVKNWLMLMSYEKTNG